MSKDPGYKPSRRSFLTGLGGGLVGFAVDACTPPPVDMPTPSRRSNILLFFIDDLGWSDVGYMGHQVHQTPNIDRLASQGMIFTDAYSNAPVCAPTRASLLTGQYGPRHGIYSVSHSGEEPASGRTMLNIKNDHVLPRECVTFMETLAAASYRGASIGKWHLGKDPLTGPRSQGFHVNVAGNDRGFPANGYFPPYGNPDLLDGPPGEYLTERLTEEAISFLEANRDNPFMLYLSHFGVHDPLQARKDLVDKYRKAGSKNPTYAAMVDSVDTSIGRVLKRLETLGLADDTLVIFASDNGGHGCYTGNDPLRGAKSTLYEGGIRVPMCARWPGRIKPGSSSDVPVMTADLYPTFLEAAKVKAPADKILDGESLVPLFKGRGKPDREAIYWHYPVYMQSDQCMTKTWCTTPVGAIRKGRYKLMEYFAPRGTPCTLELYDLEEDIGETTNLAKKLPAKTAELLADMQSWRQRLNAPVPCEPNPAYVPGHEQRMPPNPRKK